MKKVLVTTSCALALAGGWAASSAIPQEASRPSLEDRLRAQLVIERRQARVALGQAETRRVRQVRGLKATLLSRPNVKTAIKLASVTHGVPYRTLYNVAWCESRLVVRARNPVSIWNGEHAVGLMGFVPSTWRNQTPQGRAGMDVFDPYVHMMGAADLIRRDGLRQWHCKADGRPHG